MIPKRRSSKATWRALLGVVAVAAVAAAVTTDATPSRAEGASAPTELDQLWGFVSSSPSTGSSWSAQAISAASSMGQLLGVPTVLGDGTHLLAVATTVTGAVVVGTTTSPNAPSWTMENLSNVLGIGPVDTTPGAALDAAGGLEVVIRTEAGQLLLADERFANGSPWQLTNLTAAAHGPSVIGQPSLTTSGASTEVFARTPTGHLVEFTTAAVGQQSWEAIDLTRLAGAPLISSDPAVATNGAVHYLAALGPGGSIVELADDDATLRFWSARTLHLPQAGVGRPSLVVAAGQPWVFAQSAKGDLLAATGTPGAPVSTWTEEDLTAQITGAPALEAPPTAISTGSGLVVAGESIYGGLTTYDTSSAVSTASFSVTEVRASDGFSATSDQLAGIDLNGQVGIWGLGTSNDAGVGTGVYAIPVNDNGAAVADGWPVLGVTGALGAPTSPYTATDNGQNFAVGKAVAQANHPVTWLSFWTVSGPPIDVHLAGISCASSCVGVGSYTDVSGTSRAVVLFGTTAGFTSAEPVPVPSGAAVNPAEQLSAVSCAAAGRCTAVGAVTLASGSQVPLWVTITGTSLGLSEAQAPPSSASPAQASFDGVACPAVSSCVAVGSFLDPAGRTEDLLGATSTSGTHTLAAPPGASSNPRDVLAGVSCTSLTTCVAVGSFTTPSGTVHPLVGFLNGAGEGTLRAAPLPTGALRTASAQFTAVSCPATCFAVGGGTTASGATVGTTASFTTSAVGASSFLAAPAHAAANPNSTLEAISCAAVNVCEAVGAATSAAGTVLGYGTTLFASVPNSTAFITPPANSLASPSMQLDALGCLTSGNCVAGGTDLDSGGDPRALTSTVVGVRYQPSQTTVLPASAAAASPAHAYYVAGQAAGSYVGSSIASYANRGLKNLPAFVILDPEGYPDLHSGLDGPPGPASTAKWTQLLAGWAAGLRGVDPKLRPGVYSDQYEYNTYGLSQLAIPEFLAVAWNLTTATNPKTGLAQVIAPPTINPKIAQGPNIEGIISFNDWCPSDWAVKGTTLAQNQAAFESQITRFNKAPWNGTYNTVQFLNASDYCAPS